MILCSKHKIFYGLLPLFLLFFSFFFSFFSVNDTYALEDITYTIDSSNVTTKPYYFCDNSNSSLPDCTGYNYLVASISDSCSFDNSASIVYFQFYNSRVTTNPIFQPQFYKMQLFEFPSNYGSPSRLGFADASYIGSYLTNGCQIFVTVSENNPYASGIIPSGSLSITENGTYDVTNYAEAVVNVPESSGGGSGGNYHEDLVNIYHAIMICGAIVLVLYFFYCIYRVIIKSTGGK